MPTQLAHRRLAAKVGAGQIVEDQVHLHAEQITHPRIQRIFDLLLDREQAVQRAIPAVQLSILDLDPSLLGDLLGRQPIRRPAFPPSVADEGVLQPPGQSVLAARLAQTIGDQDERRLGHVELVPPQTASLADDPTQLHLVPQVPGHQHRPPDQRLAAADLVFASQPSAAILAQRRQQVVQLVVELIQSAEVGHDPLCRPPVVAIGLDDLQISVGLVCPLDRRDPSEHGHRLRAWAAAQSLSSLPHTT